jgi:hypothetical protein
LLKQESNQEHKHLLVQDNTHVLESMQGGAKQTMLLSRKVREKGSPAEVPRVVTAVHPHCPAWALGERRRACYCWCEVWGGLRGGPRLGLWNDPYQTSWQHAVVIAMYMWVAAIYIMGLLQARA